jgi:hypothetical protein
MQEPSGDKPATPLLGIESVLKQQTATPKSGRRMLQNTAEYNPNTFVEKGRAGQVEYYQQKLQGEAFSPYWRGYAKDKERNVTGVLLDNDILFWIPLDKSLTASKMLGLVGSKYPQTQVVGRFNLTGRPMSGSVPELAVESGGANFDEKMDGLIDYFGKSLDWEERIVRLNVSYASGQKPFSGSLQEYLVSH